jgi:hypothetical protein
MSLSQIIVWVYTVLIYRIYHDWHALNDLCFTIEQSMLLKHVCYMHIHTNAYWRKYVFNLMLRNCPALLSSRILQTANSKQYWGLLHRIRALFARSWLHWTVISTSPTEERTEVKGTIVIVTSKHDQVDLLYSNWFLFRRSPARQPHVTALSCRTSPCCHTTLPAPI